MPDQWLRQLGFEWKYTFGIDGLSACDSREIVFVSLEVSQVWQPRTLLVTV